MTLPTLAQSDRHEFLWSPVSPPLTVQPGDILQQIGEQLVVTTVAENMLIGKAFRNSPDGSNKTTQVGAAVSVNLLADVPVVYTEAD